MRSESRMASDIISPAVSTLMTDCSPRSETGDHSLDDGLSHLSVDANPTRSPFTPPMVPGSNDRHPGSPQGGQASARSGNRGVTFDQSANPAGSSQHSQNPQRPRHLNNVSQRTADSGYIERESDSSLIPSKSSLKSIEENMKNVTEEIQSRLDSVNSDLYSSSSCSSLPDDEWKQEIAKYSQEMEPDIKTGYFDVMILYADEDREEAERFRAHLVNDIRLANGECVKAVLYDCEEMTSLAGSKLQHLEKALYRSTYVFVYLTEKFLTDKWMELSSEECLMKAIYDPVKKWCVVPVYTKKRGTFRIPMGLNSLKGINYYNNDDFYRRGVGRLIGDKLYVRKRAEEKHLLCQKRWVEDFKKKKREEMERLKRMLMKLKLEKEEHEENLKKETERLRKDGFRGISVPAELQQHFGIQIHPRYLDQNSSLQHSHSDNSIKPQATAVSAYLEDLRNIGSSVDSFSSKTPPPYHTAVYADIGSVRETPGASGVPTAGAPSDRAQVAEQMRQQAIQEVVKDPSRLSAVYNIDPSLALQLVERNPGLRQYLPQQTRSVEREPSLQQYRERLYQHQQKVQMSQTAEEHATLHQGGLMFANAAQHHCNNSAPQQQWHAHQEVFPSVPNPQPSSFPEPSSHEGLQSNSAPSSLDAHGGLPKFDRLSMASDQHSAQFSVGQAAASSFLPERPSSLPPTSDGGDGSPRPADQVDSTKKTKSDAVEASGTIVREIHHHYHHSKKKVINIMHSDLVQIGSENYAGSGDAHSDSSDDDDDEEEEEEGNKTKDETQKKEEEEDKSSLKKKMMKGAHKGNDSFNETKGKDKLKTLQTSGSGLTSRGPSLTSHHDSRGQSPSSRVQSVGIDAGLTSTEEQARGFIEEPTVAPMGEKKLQALVEEVEGSVEQRRQQNPGSLLHRELSHDPQYAAERGVSGSGKVPCGELEPGTLPTSAGKVSPFRGDTGRKVAPVAPVRPVAKVGPQRASPSPSDEGNEETDLKKVYRSDETAVKQVVDSDETEVKKLIRSGPVGPTQGTLAAPSATVNASENAGQCQQVAPSQNVNQFFPQLSAFGRHLPQRLMPSSPQEALVQSYNSGIQNSGRQPVNLGEDPLSCSPEEDLNMADAPPELEVDGDYVVVERAIESNTVEVRKPTERSRKKRNGRNNSDPCILS